MGGLEILLISIGLAMDAFAVSICKGLSLKTMSWKKAIKAGLYFGFFQAIMPLLGYFLGATFESVVTKIDHWIAFGLLCLIGINMLKEAFGKNEENQDDKMDFKTMSILALATSIDALAVGITFAFLKVNMAIATTMIGIVTFAICVIGVKIGNKFGDKYERKAEVVGGLILIFMGIKILIEHLGIF